MRTPISHIIVTIFIVFLFVIAIAFEMHIISCGPIAKVVLTLLLLFSFFGIITQIVEDLDL